MNVLHIPADQDFLAQLARGISHRLSKWRLDEITILLPTQRACDKLAEEFSSSDKKPIMLSLGNLEDSKSNLQAISPLTHKLLLGQALAAKSSVKYSEALILASELHKIIAKFDRDNVPLIEINNIKLGDAPRHIQQLVDYLKLIAENKIEVLQQNKVSHLTKRNLEILNLIDKWQVTDHSPPIIAAGIEGYTKPIASLLSTIARLKNGFIVVQGMDALPESSWSQMDEFHHSFLTKTLLDELGLQPNQVQTWSYAPSWCHPRESGDPVSCSTVKESLDSRFRGNDIGDGNDNRGRFLSEAMCPAEHSVHWHKLESEDFSDLDNIEYIECKSLQEEALVIALKLKELSSYEKTIAIVTNEINLIKRLKPLAKLFNINIQDSFGLPCSATPQMSFIYTLLDACTKNFAPMQLLSLLKHQFYNNSGNNLAIERLELKYLRGICKYKTIEELIELVAKDDEEISILLETIVASCKSLIMYASFSDILESVLSTVDKIASQDTWEGDIAIKVREFLEDIRLMLKHSSQIDIEEFKSILYQCFQGKYLEILPTNTEQMNVYVLNPVESRLLHFDYVILAGLNESSWPTSIATDPWLISNLPQNIGLSNPHIPTGQAAHDFFCLMHHKNILITRSEIIEGSPQIPSRWLVRLETLAKQIGKLGQLKPKLHYLLLQARNFYTPTEQIKYDPPTPKPPRTSRPHSLSVTQIETLIRDPYSIYVSKILKLKKLEPVDKTPTYAEFGNFIHKVIDRFNKNFKEAHREDQLQILMRYAREELRHISSRPIVARMWLPRFEKIAQWLIEFEHTRRLNNRIKVYSEVNGSIVLPTSNGSFTLTAKADRIEVIENTGTIVDFKTGSIPSKSDMLSGFSPQLSLEALIANKYGFNITILNVSQLLYIQLSVGSKLGDITPANAELKEIEQGVTQLINLYMDENTPYLICPNPDKQPSYNDFEHLERVQEWLR